MTFVVFSVLLLVTVGSLAVPHRTRYQHRGRHEQEQRAREEHLQLLREQQLERQEMQLEELREVIETSEGLQQIAEQLGLELVGRSLRPYLQLTTAAPLENCVTRSAMVELQPGLTSGVVTFRVCGVGTNTKIQFRFFVPGETTTAADTTTSAETTTEDTTTVAPTTTTTENVTTTMTTTTESAITSPLPPKRPARGCACPAVFVVAVQHQAPPAPPAVPQEKPAVQPKVEKSVQLEEETTTAGSTTPVENGELWEANNFAA